MFGVGGALGGFCLTPNNPTSLLLGAFPTVGGAMGVILGFVIVFAFIFAYHLFRAPYRQRNDARTDVEQLEHKIDKLNQEHISRMNDMQEKLSDPILLENQKEHSDNIRTLIESWLGSLSVPKISEVEPGTTSPMDKVKHNIRFDYLKEHLPSTKLWQNYTNWDSKMQEYLDKCKKLCTEIQAAWKIDPILKMIDGEELRFITAYGTGHPLEEVSGQMLSVNGIDVVRGNSFEALGYSACPHSTLGMEYQKLANKFLNQPLIAELKQLSSSLITISSNIQESLRQILEKADYIKHSCKDCPIREEPT